MRSSAPSGWTCRSTRARCGATSRGPATGSSSSTTSCSAGSSVTWLPAAPGYAISTSTTWQHRLQVPASAHAKLILLADASGGTLLVGSGNVGIDGYASRGEVFCRYDMSPTTTPTCCAAFHTAKDLLGTMTARGYLDTQVSTHLDHMWSECRGSGQQPLAMPARSATTWSAPRRATRGQHRGRARTRSPRARPFLRRPL